MPAMNVILPRISLPGTIDRRFLETLYARLNRREFAPPDPVHLLYVYRNPNDREIAGLVASCLAYGRVQQIVKSVRRILDPLGPDPHRTLTEASPKDIQTLTDGFRHRFTGEDSMFQLLLGIRSAIGKYGSLNTCFVSGLKKSDKTVESALQFFVTELNCSDTYLIPSPAAGSACKRLNLFLKWMVRKDKVDPGGWRGVSPRQLIVPLDVHMRRIGHKYGLTRRRTPDMKMAQEITDGFRQFCPEDPTRYDFALTRPGIWSNLSRAAQEERNVS